MAINLYELPGAAGYVIEPLGTHGSGPAIPCAVGLNTYIATCTRMYTRAATSLRVISDSLPREALGRLVTRAEFHLETDSPGRIIVRFPAKCLRLITGELQAKRRAPIAAVPGETYPEWSV